MNNQEKLKQQVSEAIGANLSFSATVDERIYRGIGETIKYGIWICDPSGKNIYASDSFLKLVGLTQEQCSEFGWGKVLDPNEAEATLNAWRECVQEGTFWERTHRVRGTDGLWHYILARGVPIKNDEGKILCWAGINLDMDEQKRVELELATLASIVQHSYDPIICQDLDCIIDSCNASAERLYGYSAGEMIGRHIGLLFAPQYLQDLPKLMFLLNQGKVVNNVETGHVTKENQMLYVSVTISPIQNRFGETIRSSMIVRDLTEKKNLEREHAKLLANNSPK